MPQVFPSAAVAAADPQAAAGSSSIFSLPLEPGTGGGTRVLRRLAGAARSPETSAIILSSENTPSSLHVCIASPFGEASAPGFVGTVPDSRIIGYIKLEAQEFVDELNNILNC